MFKRPLFLLLSIACSQQFTKQDEEQSIQHNEDTQQEDISTTPNTDTTTESNTDTNTNTTTESNTDTNTNTNTNTDTNTNTNTETVTESDTGTEESLPKLSDLWNGDAEFVLDGSHGPFGPLSFHFLSTFWDSNQMLWAYYILHGQQSFVTGLATSEDGLTFDDYGVVLNHGGVWQWSYHSVTDLFHLTGSADSDGWAASVANDTEGYLSYGPYVSTLPEGKMTVEYELMIDNNSADDVAVVNLDIYDVTADTVLAAREITRTEFNATFSYQKFAQEYTQVSGHSLEFRVYWFGNSYIRIREIGVTQGQEPFTDNILATFPGVWQDNGIFYMVYEGSGLSSEGNIHLATSTDGYSWIKDASNPILVHESNGWESVNIGTPSLWKEGNTWYLFYHGYDGNDCQVGLATGSDLQSMTRVSSLPIVPVSATGWDAGTIGKRSIFQDGNYYYMVYEGSTDPPYSTARWSSGIARSSDLQNWEKYSGNPVLPQTGTGFGYDGPEFIETPDGRLHIYYRAQNDGRTYRSTLTWK